MDEQLRDLLVGLETVRNATRRPPKQTVMVQMGARARAADQAETAASGASLWTRERREQFVPDEIAVLLGCTKMAATVRYGTACHAADLPVVAQAWRSGVIDARKVATIGEQLAHLDAPTPPTLIRSTRRRSPCWCRRWLLTRSGT